MLNSMRHWSVLLTLGGRSSRNSAEKIGDHLGRNVSSPSPSASGRGAQVYDRNPFADRRRRVMNQAGGLGDEGKSA
jgi:hypothetical protein